MKKNLAIIGVCLSALILVFAASCSFPDYLLDFGIDSYSQLGGAGTPITVNYHINNIGNKDMANVVLRLELDASDGTHTDYTSSTDLYVNEFQNRTHTFYVNAGVTPSDVTIIGAGWDTKDSNY